MARPSLSDAEREQRRRQLLDAAYGLFHQAGDLPTVAAIAEAAGLAKGTVYLYFRTKEEIFVALLEDNFRSLFGDLFAFLPHLPSSPEQAAPAFAQAYVAAIGARGELMKLAAMGNTVLEQNLPLEALQRFKSDLAAGLEQAGLQLEHKLGMTPAGAGAALLLQTYGLTIGLWQALDYPSAIRPTIASTPALRVLARDFKHELEQAVTRLWRGALA